MSTFKSYEPIAYRSARSDKLKEGIWKKGHFVSDIPLVLQKNRDFLRYSLIILDENANAMRLPDTLVLSINEYEVLKTSQPIVLDSEAILRELSKLKKLIKGY